MIDERLRSIEKKNITLDDLYKVVADGDIAIKNQYMTIRYDEFYDIVIELINSSKIVPYGKQTNNKYKSLPLKYHLNIDKPCVRHDIEDLKWIHRLNKKIDTMHYLNNPEEFIKDREYIAAINNFLSNYVDAEFVGINERSYDIFGDEKFIKGGKDIQPYGDMILKKLDLSYSDIKCYENYEPLLCLITSEFYIKNSKTILIVENLDTYWSFNRILLDYKLKSKLGIDMLVFGQGNKITGGFANYKSYNITDNDIILYFGDIDYHGFDIYRRLKDKYENLNIELYKEMYEKALTIGICKGLGKTKSQNQSAVEDGELRRLLGDFSNNHMEKIIGLLKDGYYIPQETVNYQVLREGI